MKKEVIGTREMDMFFAKNHYMNEDEELREDDVLPEGCRLRPSKTTYFKLRINGKQHPLTDKILLWQNKMESAGRYDEIPDTTEEIVALFEANPNLLDEFE